MEVKNDIIEQFKKLEIYNDGYNDGFNKALELMAEEFLQPKPLTPKEFAEMYLNTIKDKG